MFPHLKALSILCRQGEPEIFESKPAAGRRAPCGADQAFALRRWNGTELTERTWTVVVQHGSTCGSFQENLEKVKSDCRSWSIFFSHLFSSPSLAICTVSRACEAKVMESGTVGVVVQSINDGYDADIIQVLDGTKETPHPDISSLLCNRARHIDHHKSHVKPYVISARVC